MVSNSSNRWTVAGTTFVLWALVAASAVYWGLKLSSGSPKVPALPAARTAPPADPIAVARLLGSTPTAAAAGPSLASRFVLTGVVASGEKGGAALIAVDGKPPRPFRVGAAIDEGLLLQSVDARHANLGPAIDRPPSVTLELPLRKQ
jgi:general secretion pathway protein C